MIEVSKKTSVPGQKIIIGSLFSNLFLGILKLLTGIFGNSFALIADSIESFSDVISSVILFIGLKVSVKERDENHPYGHGKAEPIASIILTFLLFAAAVFIITESIHNIRTPHKAPASFTLILLGAIIFVKEILFRFVNKAGEAHQSSAMKAEAWHHRSDALSSLAAFIGITIALIGGEGYESADDWAALAASGLVIYNAWSIMKSALDELMDVAPDPSIAEQVKNIARKVPGVVELDKCLVRKMGFDFYVDLHVMVNGDISVKEGHKLAHDVKNQLLKDLPKVKDVLIHIEPAD